MYVTIFAETCALAERNRIIVLTGGQKGGYREQK